MAYAQPPLDAAQTIAPALRYTWAMLTRPFSLRKWLVLALVSLLAGMFGGGPSVNIPSGGNWPGGRKPEQVEPYVRVLSQWVTENIALLVVMGLVLFVLTLATLYLAAVFRFVFLDSVARNRVQVKRAFSENWERGLALFLWHLGYGLVAIILLGSLVVAVALPAAMLWRAGPGTGGAVALVVVLVVLGAGAGVVLGIALLLIGAILADFVLPAMYLEQRGVWSGWSRILGLIRAEPGKFALYYVLKIPLGLAAGIASALLSVAGLVVAAIPLGIVALAGVGIALAAGTSWAWTPPTIFVTVFGGGVVLVYLMYAAACATLPVPVFWQAWALAFLGERDRTLAVLRLPGRELAS